MRPVTGFPEDNLCEIVSSMPGAQSLYTGRRRLDFCVMKRMITRQQQA
jgi:hypothetical protein